jgi:hypothetical protein
MMDDLRAPFDHNYRRSARRDHSVAIGSIADRPSIVVNASNFSVTLASGSSLTVTSPTLQQLSSDVTSDVVNNTSVNFKAGSKPS